mgnify:CR=1 FL=1
MPGLPKIPKFKGDNSQSFKIWILQFEAQCTALGHEKDRWRELLLCCLEGKAFNYLSYLITQSEFYKLASQRAKGRAMRAMQVM